jgi:NAD(P)H-flavin reductase
MDYKVVISEIQFEEAGLSARFEKPDRMEYRPGQYFLAYAPTLEEINAVPLFIQKDEGNALLTVPGIPSEWQAGTMLSMRGPLGNGFTLPASQSRIAMASFHGSGKRLLPLLNLALSSGCEISFYRDSLDLPLPPLVEIFPLESLNKALPWADRIAIEMNLDDVSRVRELLLGGFTARAHPPMECLVHAPILCDGRSECGVCAVKTRQGWKFACKDGPVFALKDLEE